VGVARVEERIKLDRLLQAQPARPLSEAERVPLRVRQPCTSDSHRHTRHAWRVGKGQRLRAQ
jgi:hypothetical protein